MPKLVMMPPLDELKRQFAVRLPNDLGLDLKRNPDYKLKTSDECTKYVWERVKDKGIKMGMAILTEPEERQKYIDMGMTMFQEAPRK